MKKKQEEIKISEKIKTENGLKKTSKKKIKKNQ